MSDRLYNTIVYIISFIWAGSFLLLAIYTMHLYEICSIISYIANKG